METHRIVLDEKYDGKDKAVELVDHKGNVVLTILRNKDTLSVLFDGITVDTKIKQECDEESGNVFPCYWNIRPT